MHNAVPRQAGLYIQRQFLSSTETTTGSSGLRLWRNKRQIPLAVACLITFAYHSTAQDAGGWRDLRDVMKVQGGLAVVVEPGESNQITGMLDGDKWLAHGLVAEECQREKIAVALLDSQRDGHATVELWQGPSLPMEDMTVDLFWLRQADKITRDEIARVMVPGGAVVMPKGAAFAEDETFRRLEDVAPAGCVAFRRAFPKTMDGWSHQNYDATNNSVSKDRTGGKPQRLRWMGHGEWLRHHETQPSLMACVADAGRLFYIHDEGLAASVFMPARWTLVARNAFNGKILWKRPVTSLYSHMRQERGPANTTRSLVALYGKVYTALGENRHLAVLDGASGGVIFEREDIQNVEEIRVDDCGAIFVASNPARDTTAVELAAATILERNKTVSKQAQNDAHRILGGLRTIWALVGDSGKTCWRVESVLAPTTLAIGDEKVLFASNSEVFCLSENAGGKIWTYVARKDLSDPKSWLQNPPHLMVWNDLAIYSSGGHGRGVKVTVLALGDGKRLWDGDAHNVNYDSANDLKLIEGKLWDANILYSEFENKAIGGTSEFRARDPYSGKVVRSFVPEEKADGFGHHRCYPSKATGDFWITSRTGVELVDLAKGELHPNNWVRGACNVGIVPAHGLITITPTPCACYPEARLNGFFALAPSSKSPIEPIADEQRLHIFATKDQPAGDDVSEEDWPTYRGANNRSGYCATAVKPAAKPRWTVQLGGDLTQTVVAGKSVFLSRKDANMLIALDLESGAIRWRFLTGGSVDTPPTIWRRRVYAGGRDGVLYCLDAATGKPIWTFMAARADRRIVADDRLESVWPLHGSPLIEDGKLYLLSGRSMFLDGGLTFHVLDAESGKLLHQSGMDKFDPETGKELAMIPPFNMPVALTDILVSDGKTLFLRSQPISKEGVRGPLRRKGKYSASREPFLFAPVGFLEDSWQHRQNWLFNTGEYIGGSAYSNPMTGDTPIGQIIAFDSEKVFAFGWRKELAGWRIGLEYRLYATPVKGGKPVWQVERLPLLARSMACAENAMFLSGPPDVFDELSVYGRLNTPETQRQIAEQDAAYRGERGGLLYACDKATGELSKIAELLSPPVFDGLSAARGRLVLVLMNGEAVCY